MRALALAVTLAGLLVAPAARAQAGNARALKLAQSSKSARAALAYLQAQAQRLRDPQLKKAAQELLANPSPTFMARLPDAAAREAARAALVQAGLLDAQVTLEQLFPPLPAQPFLGAPGQGLHGHHSYPGGLAEHTAFNVRAALALAEDYRATYGLTGLQEDAVLAAPLLHDALKPWVLQWNADGTQTVQPKLAGTASHHAFIVAEALYRGLPADLVVALASAHEPPLGEGAAKVVGFLRAGALLAGVDPVALGLLKPEGQGWVLARPAPIEGAINHLSDHDYVLTDPAAQATDAALDRLARAASPPPGRFAAERPPDEARLRWMRYRIQAAVPGVALYAALRGGDAALQAELARRKVPLLDAKD